MLMKKIIKLLLMSKILVDVLSVSKYDLIKQYLYIYYFSLPRPPEKQLLINWRGNRN